MNFFAPYFNAFRTVHVCAILCAMTSLLYAADPVVSNISAVQRAGTKLTVHLVATFGHEDELYSFAPALIRKAKGLGFSGDELRAEEFQNLDAPRTILTDNLNSAVRKTEPNKVAAKDVWTVVRDKCLHAGCVEGFKFSI